MSAGSCPGQIAKTHLAQTIVTAVCLGLVAPLTATLVGFAAIVHVVLR